MELLLSLGHSLSLSPRLSLKSSVRVRVRVEARVFSRTLEELRLFGSTWWQLAGGFNFLISSTIWVEIKLLLYFIRSRHLPLAILVIPITIPIPIPIQLEIGLYGICLPTCEP